MKTSRRPQAEAADGGVEYQQAAPRGYRKRDYFFLSSTLPTAVGSIVSVQFFCNWREERFHSYASSVLSMLYCRYCLLGNAKALSALESCA